MGTRNTPSCLMLKTPEISAGLLGHLARCRLYRTSHIYCLTSIRDNPTTFFGIRVCFSPCSERESESGSQLQNK